MVRPADRHIHEAIERPGGVVFRCDLTASDANRWLEIPAWMFDRSACAKMRLAVEPHTDLSALVMLGGALAGRTEQTFYSIGCRRFGPKSRLRESAQGDKWSFCLTAGKIGPRIRREHEQETAPKPCIGL